MISQSQILKLIVLILDLSVKSQSRIILHRIQVAILSPIINLINLNINQLIQVEIQNRIISQMIRVVITGQVIIHHHG